MIKHPPLKGSRRAYVPLGASAALLATSALMAVLSGAAESEELWPFIGTCCGIAGLALILAVRRLGFGWASAPVVYLSYLWLFHFPLLLLISLSPDMLRRLPAYIQQWTVAPSWYRASLIALACAAAFAVGASVSSSGQIRAVPAPRWNQCRSLVRLGLAEAVLGLGLIASSIVQGGGAQVLEMGYGDLFSQVFRGPFGYGVVIFTIGGSTLLAGARNHHLRVLFGIQVLWSCLMLLLGARSAALLAILIAAVVLAKRGYRISHQVAIVSLIIVLWLIAGVGVARQGGVKANLAEVRSANPLDALLEMGGSLHTVSLFDNWLSNGDALQLGKGYWLPFERAIGIVVPHMRSDLATDPRSASAVLSSRTTGLGGSVVAEAYYNFGLFAPMLVFAPLGWLIGYLDRAARSPFSTALLTVVLYPLLMEIRGWFISVPAMIALGAIPLVLLTLGERSRLPIANGDSRVRPHPKLC